MKNIRISDKDLGECIVNAKNNIEKREGYLIKSLCILQIMCLNSHESPEKFDEFVNIIDNAANQIKALYGEQNEGPDGTEDFSN